jgi:hypothetical protein
MKKIYFFFFLIFISFAICAQQQLPIPPNSVTDQKSINGFTVKLIPTIQGGYGYDIFLNDKLVVHQFQNPIPFAPNGIQVKEDAFKVAEWMIKDFQANGQWQNSIPPHIARELKIKTH